MGLVGTGRGTGAGLATGGPSTCALTYAGPVSRKTKMTNVVDGFERGVAKAYNPYDVFSLLRSVFSPEASCIQREGVGDDM